MSPLHGLRLNCLLAPLLAAVIGAAAVLAGAVLHRDSVARAARESDRAAIVGLARLHELGVAPPLSAWLIAHAAWSGVARVTVRQDAVSIAEQAGAIQVRDEPSPELLLAYQGMRAWPDHGQMAVAAPSLPRQGDASVVVAWRRPPQAPPWWPFLALAGGVLVLGGGLGVYLVARVYRPVEWMERAAAAAASGAGEPPGGVDSPETASLRSSIAALISQRQPSEPTDATPRS